MVKHPHASAGDVRDSGSIPGSGGSPGGGHGNPLQYSCLESPMDRGAWQATVLRVTQSWTRLKRLSTHAHVGLALGTFRTVQGRALLSGKAEGRGGVQALAGLPV